MAGTIFGELHFVQVYKIVASKVICGVRHCPRYFIVECTGSCLFPSAPLCFAFYVLLCFVDFVAGAILSERCLSPHFSGRSAARIGYTCLLRYTTVVGTSLFSWQVQ